MSVCIYLNLSLHSNLIPMRRRITIHSVFLDIRNSIFVSPAHIGITLSVVCLSVRLSVCHTPIAMFRRRHIHSWECCHYFWYKNPFLKGISVFFWVHGGINRSKGQTNRVDHEPRFVCSALRFIPHDPEKDKQSLYLQCFHQRPFLDFSEKSHKFKILCITSFDVNHCACDLSKTAELLVDCVRREFNVNFAW